MSTFDFKKRASSNISLTITGSGQFDPFQGGASGGEIDWTLGGSVYEKNDPPAELNFSCGDPFPDDKIWSIFGNVGTIGGESGFIETGLLPFNPPPEQQYGYELGTWTVNTKPVLSAGGNINGELSTKGYYVVEIAKDKTENDAIEIKPAIDEIEKVFPGDWVYSTGDETTRKWNVLPRQRFPRPDRTFFWAPNDSPFVEEDGKINGELAKPGTVILPTKDYDFEDPTKPFFLRYAQNKVGWMFNGYQWIGGSPPYRYQPPDEDGAPKPKEYRFLDVSYSHPDRFSGCLDATHRRKPFVYTSKKIADTAIITITLTPKPVKGQPPPEPYNVDLKFKWAARNDNGIQAPCSLNPIHDFQDSYTAYHQANIDWLKARNQNTLIGASAVLYVDPQTDPPQEIYLYVESFENENVTTIRNEYQVPDGPLLVNEFTITTSIQTELI